MSVREDEIAANSNGISVFRYKMIGFVIASFIGGIGGALYAPLIGFPTLKLEGDYLAIVTLAFGEIIRVVLLNQKSWTGGPNGIQFSTVFTTSLDWGATIAFASVIGTLILLIVAL